MNPDQTHSRLNPRNWSLTARLTLVMTLLIAITLAGVAYVTSQTFRKAFTNQIGETFEAEAESLADQIRDAFLEKAIQLQVLALSDVFKNTLEIRNGSYPPNLTQIREEIRTLDAQWVAAEDDDPIILNVIDPEINSITFQLNDLLAIFPVHTEIFLTDRYGATVGATARISDYDQSDEIWWREAYNGGEGAVYISDPEFDESAGIVAILVAIPIFDEDTGTVSGILRSTLNFDRLVSDALSNIEFGETGYAILLDPSKNILFDPRAETDNSAELPDDLRQTIIGTDEDFTTALDQHGRLTIFGYSRLHSEAITHRSELEKQTIQAIVDLRWSVVIRQIASEAFVEVDQVEQNILSIGLLASLIAAMAGVVIARTIAQPLAILTKAAVELGSGNLDTPLPAVTGDNEIDRLTQSLSNMAHELRLSFHNLEQKVAEVTQHLERRAAQLRVAAEVGQAAASIPAMDKLLPYIVRLISNRFGFYHVGIFLIDEASQYAILRAASSDGGYRMLLRSHQLKVGEVGLVGYVTGSGKPRIALDVGEDATHFKNPDLPETRSEIALPLTVRGTIIGALDVQSTEPNAFKEDDVQVLQTLADQVAVAINNSQLLTESQSRLEAERRTHTERTRRAWDQLSRAHSNLGYIANNKNRVIPSMGAWPSDMLHARNQGEPYLVDDAVAIPIKIRGEQVAGVVRLRKANNAEWTEEELQLMSNLTDQLGVALESARLFQEAQGRADRERLTSEITTRMRETLDVELILRTAVQQVREALNLPEVVVKLTPAVSDQPKSDGTQPLSQHHRGR